MTDAEKIDRAITTLRASRADSRESARQLNPIEHERNPSYFQKAAEREERSEWSGGRWGGGTFGGRSR